MSSTLATDFFLRCSAAVIPYSTKEQPPVLKENCPERENKDPKIEKRKKLKVPICPMSLKNGSESGAVYQQPSTDASDHT